MSRKTRSYSTRFCFCKNNKRTIIIIIEYAGKGLTCRVLMALQAGAKITAKNKGGMTALALACVKVGNTEKFLGRSIRRRGAAWPRGGPLGEGDGDIYHHKHCLCRASEVCVCFITAGPITKLCAWGEEESGGHVL